MELAHQPLVPGSEERSHAQAEMAPMIGKWEEVAPEDQFENQRNSVSPPALIVDPRVSMIRSPEIRDPNDPHS